MSLADILEEVDEQTLSEVDIDISEKVGKPAGTRVLKFRELDAATFVRAGKASKKLLVKYADWVSDLAFSVALLSYSYVPQSDDKIAPGLFFASLANKNRNLYFHIQTEWGKAFPTIAEMGEKIDEEKKDCVMEDAES